MTTPEKTPPKPNKASRAASWVLSNTPLLADWLLVEIAYLLVLSLGIFAVYCVFGLIFGNLTNSRIEKVLSLLNDNWKAVLVLAFAVFYPAIRKLLAKAKLGGIGPISFEPPTRTMRTSRRTRIREKEQRKDSSK